MTTLELLNTLLLLAVRLAILSLLIGITAIVWVMLLDLWKEYRRSRK